MNNGTLQMFKPASGAKVHEKALLTLLSNIKTDFRTMTGINNNLGVR